MNGSNESWPESNQEAGPAVGLSACHLELKGVVEMREARQTRRVLNHFWKKLRAIDKAYNSYTSTAQHRAFFTKAIRATHKKAKRI